MTNYEKYKVLIDEINDGIAVDIRTNKPVRCAFLSCENCLFHNKCRNAELLRWANSEYVEPPVDWTKVEVDTLVYVSSDDKIYIPRYFARKENDRVLVWKDGRTSMTAVDDYDIWPYKYAKLAEKE